MVLSRMSAVARRFPMLVGGCTLGTRYLIGDGITQTVIEGKKWKDCSLRRSVCFGIFGSIIGAGPLYWWFVTFLPKQYTFLPKWPAIFARSLTDAWVFMPFFYFPVFYQVKELVFWDGTRSIKEIPAIAAQKYRDGFVADTVSATKVCTPINMILFSHLVPGYLRIPALSAFGMVWVLTLSVRRGAYNPE